jgi:hypothetical protein
MEGGTRRRRPFDFCGQCFYFFLIKVCKHVENYTKSLDELAQSALVWMVLRVIATLDSAFPCYGRPQICQEIHSVAIVSTRDYGKTLDANREELA